MSILHVLRQHGLCIARVAGERQSYTWQDMPKQINVHGYVFKDMTKTYIIDSIAGGVRFDYRHYESNLVLGIMRDNASYCVTTHGAVRDIFSRNDATTSENWDVNLAISMIQHDKKLKHALDNYMDQPHVKREIARHAYR